MRLKSGLRALALALVSALTLGLISGCGSSSGGNSSSSGGSGASAGASSSASATGGPGLGSSYDVAKAGKSTLTIWWLGNQEIPGIESWMKQAIATFEKLHPTVTVNTVLQSTDTYTTTQKTACKSGTGPDIWYNWGGTWSLEQAWPGCVVPNEAVLSPEDLKPVPAIAGTKWAGHTWVYPIEQRLYPIIYNKDLFAKAHITGTPSTWTEFLADLQKLKGAGSQPLVTGLKDGFGGENLAVAIQRQVLSVPNLIQSVVDGKMSSAAWKQWLDAAYQLKPYFNNDTNSITYSQGLARFQSGKAAMIFASPGWQQTVIGMNSQGKHVGIFKVPTYTSDPRAQQLYEDTPGFQVTKFAHNPKLAGAFLAFLHTPAEMNALYESTGDIPSDTRWHPTRYKSPTDAQLVNWLKAGIDYYSANYYPTDVDTNGNFVVFQGMYGGNMTVSQALSTYQTQISKWRQLQSGELQDYQEWLKDYGH
ncbi:MAG: ABC transporter substrate-binding protein [Solirubrobacteraceae bacterium]